MERFFSGRQVAVRRVAGTGLLALACLTLSTQVASASGLTVPTLALAQGPVVALPCANPANHGLDGQVLAASVAPAGGAMSCDARAVGYAGANGPAVMSGPKGYGPAQIQSAYVLGGLPTPPGATVAVVDAYNDPNAASDLATYRSTYGLAPCTTASACLKVINQTGATSPLPTDDPGWAEEESLDLDTVSATCPGCKIVLVEANSAQTTDLIQADDAAAAAPGVVAISNSWTGSESASELVEDSYLNHPGLAITAAAGDSGYGVGWPAASPYVTAVGGTTLSTASNARGYTETVWDDTGSGCSAYEPKPSWQLDTGCTRRTDNDVAADANPNTGLAVYDTYNKCGSGPICDLLIELGFVQGLDGWEQVGGTSLSSPLIASVYALAGNEVGIQYGDWPYSHSSSLFDVTSGSNGTCLLRPYLCHAGTGYDGPTGLGTPDGTGAF